jgi:DNA-damage-inducible protein J
MGLSVSDAVRLFLHRVVVDKAFPLELKVPNAETLAAMTEAEEISRAGRARFSTANQLFADLEKNGGK